MQELDREKKGLVKMIESLEERLSGFEAYDEQLVKALLAEKIVPEKDNCSYLKLDLAERIAGFLRSKGVHLREREGDSTALNRVYRSMNKKPLKRVEYGILNSKEIPTVFFEKLTERKALYFLAGVWIKKSAEGGSLKYNQDLLNKQPTDLIITETIIAGINWLRKKHQEEKTTGRYATEPMLPYADEILNRYVALRSAYVERKKGENISPELKAAIKNEDAALRVVRILENTINTLNDPINRTRNTLNDPINRTRVNDVLERSRDALEQATERVAIMMYDGTDRSGFADAIAVFGKRISNDRYAGIKPNIKKVVDAILSVGEGSIDPQALDRLFTGVPATNYNLPCQREFNFD